MKESLKIFAWQYLMDDAYSKWREEKTSYQDFIESLEKPSLRSVILGNMNNQVQNGGFSQWVANDYYNPNTKPYIEETMAEMPDTPSVINVRSMLNKLEEALEEFSYTDNIWGADWKYDGNYEDWMRDCPNLITEDDFEVDEDGSFYCTEDSKRENPCQPEDCEYCKYGPNDFEKEINYLDIDHKYYSQNDCFEDDVANYIWRMLPVWTKVKIYLKWFIKKEKK